jgi:hypothetical protein
MVQLSRDQFRDLLAERLGATNDALEQLDWDQIPPQLIEAQVDLETGGTFDTELRSPAGAIGLGQIVPGGLEYGVYKDNVRSDLTPDMLTDPGINLDVMLYGMAYRKELGENVREAGGYGGAWADWFMAAAGYLGGASNQGFNGASDSYGTDGTDYVRILRQKIQSRWGKDVADKIDSLGRGAAVIQGGDWMSDSAPITYDPDAPEVNEESQRAILNELGESLGLEVGEKTGTGIDDQITRAVMAAVGPIVEMVKEYAPRAGIALAGILAAAMGAYVLVKGRA